MKLLEKNHYDKVIKPLRQVTINHLFARSVVEKKMEGWVYVDNTESPDTYYIAHPYGLSLLFGKTSDPTFNAQFIDYALNTNKIRSKNEWLQVFPEIWENKVSELFGDRLGKLNNNIENKRIIEYTRVNFKFNKLKYLELKLQECSDVITVVRTDQFMFESMPGSVIPKYFWNNAEEFCNNGIGFGLIYENRLASTAYSAFIHENQLEVGIETVAEYRGKGFALQACSSLINYCLENNYEPVWSCRLDNTGSYQLAQKLGFEPTLYIPIYRLDL